MPRGINDLIRQRELELKERAERVKEERAARTDALAAARENRAIRTQQEDIGLRRQQFDATLAHQAATEAMASRRDARDQALKYFQLTQESLKMQRETKQLLDAAGFQRGYAMIDKWGTDRDKKLAELHNAFPEARLNAGINDMIKGDNADIDKFRAPLAAHEMELLKTYAPGGRERTKLEKLAADPNQSGSAAAALKLDQIWNTEKRAAGLMPGEDVEAKVAAVRATLTGGGQQAVVAPPAVDPTTSEIQTPVQAEAPVATPPTITETAPPPPPASVPITLAAPPASTPKEQQQSQWAATPSTNTEPPPVATSTPEENKLRSASDYINSKFNAGTQ